MINRSLLIIFNAIVAAAFFSAAGLLMMSVELKRNGDTNGRGVRISWTNLICKTPSPNLEISERELADYWTLPRTTQLSASMIETGRCAIAVNKRNRKYAAKWNHELCYCINDWWVPMMTIAALACGLYACFDFVTGLVLKHAEEETIWGRHRLIRYLMIGVSMGAVTFGRKDDFSYTGYGDVFPSAYFDRLPTTWGIALWLFFSAGILEAFCGCVLAVLSKRCKQEKVSKGTKIVVTYPVGIALTKLPCGCVFDGKFVHISDGHDPLKCPVFSTTSTATIELPQHRYYDENGWLVRVYGTQSRCGGWKVEGDA